MAARQRSLTKAPPANGVNASLAAPLGCDIRVAELAGAHHAPLGDLLRLFQPQHFATRSRTPPQQGVNAFAKLGAATHQGTPLILAAQIARQQAKELQRVPGARVKGKSQEAKASAPSLVLRLKRKTHLGTSDLFVGIDFIYFRHLDYGLPSLPKNWGRIATPYVCCFLYQVLHTKAHA